MSAICIIPARSGSKRIPGKNTKPFLGRPIIKYPLGQAIKAGIFSDIIISTDDRNFPQFDLALKMHERSPETATDEAELEEVLYEVLEGYKQIDYCCLLLPCAVFATAELLREGLGMLERSTTAHAVIPIVRFGYPPQRALYIAENQRAYMGVANHGNSQGLESLYHDAGQFYWLDVDAFRMHWQMKRTRILELQNKVINMLPSEVQDIDNLDDWAIAEMKYRRLHVSDDNA